MCGDEEIAAYNALKWVVCVVAVCITVYNVVNVAAQNKPCMEVQRGN